MTQVGVYHSFYFNDWLVLLRLLKLTSASFSIWLVLRFHACRASVWKFL